MTLFVRTERMKLFAMIERLTRSGYSIAFRNEVGFRITMKSPPPFRYVVDSNVSLVACSKEDEPEQRCMEVLERLHQDLEMKQNRLQS